VKFTSRKLLRIFMVSHAVIGRSLYAASNLRVLSALASRGHEVTCVTAKITHSPRDLTDLSAMRLKPVPFYKEIPIVSFLFYELAVTYHALRSIRQCDVIILDVEIAPAILPFLLLRRLAGGFPILFLRVSSNPVETGGMLRSLFMSFRYALAIKFSALFFDKLCFISPMLADTCSRYGISAGKIMVWPSAVDTRAFDPHVPLGVNDLRGELGLSEGLSVIYHGVLTEGRGIMDTVEAFKILKDSAIKATITLLGDGPVKREVSRYVKANHLEDVAILRGPVDYLDVPRYIAAHDVGLIPLPDDPWWRNQFPIKALEYLAMNKPVIVSNIPAHRWILGNATVATYLKGTSAREIAIGIRAYLMMSRHSDSQVGRQIAIKFSSEKVAETVENQIMSVIRDRVGKRS
jgi:glycosyltransferase involved in cell wall biosynthesis